MEFSDDKKETPVSKFSGGISIQIRLDMLWKDCHRHSRSGLFRQWNADLDCIWIELAGDIKYKSKSSNEEEEIDAEYNNFKKEYDEFDAELLKCGDFKDNATEGFNTLTQEDLTKRAKQYKVLMEKSLFLKRLEKFLGKGSQWQDDDEDDF